MGTPSECRLRGPPHPAALGATPGARFPLDRRALPRERRLGVAVQQLSEYRVLAVQVVLEQLGVRAYVERDFSTTQGCGTNPSRFEMNGHGWPEESLRKVLLQ